MCKSLLGEFLRPVQERLLNHAVSQVVNTRTMDEGPEWYDTVDSKQTYSRGDLQDLKYLNTLMNNARKDAADGKDLTHSLGKIRQRLQQMEFYTSLSPILVKKSSLLDDGGLRVLFENSIENVNIPFDIRADADILFRKWMSGQIDPHLFRGIETKSGTGKEDRRFKSHSIEQDFAGKVSCNYVGAGNLVNGQWWPLQICAKRDGAHGEIEAGIHGQVSHLHRQHSLHYLLTLFIEREGCLLRSCQWRWVRQPGQR